MIGKAIIGAGSTSQADGYLKGIVTEVNSRTVGVKVLSHVTAAGVESDVDYQPAGTYAFNNTGSVTATPTGVAIGHASGYSTSYSSQRDWFEQQTVGLSTGLDPLEWDQLADRPSTSAYAASRGGRFDEVHVVVIDDK